MQKISSIHKLIWQILGSHELNEDHYHFWPGPPKNHWNKLSFCEFAPACKQKFIPPIYSWDTANFRVIWPDWAHPFLTIPTKKYFDQLLIYVNLYQHTKNQAISLICSGNMLDWKILQSDWLKTFWPVSQELKFSQIWDLCRNIANNINFNIEQIP